MFCGASPGGHPAFMRLAFDVGALLAALSLRTVYGGSRDGCMGAVADGALSRGGEVLGVIPEKFVPWEIAHAGITEMRIVPGMAERKAELLRESDMFLVLPGGLGTLDELFEVLTFNALGYMSKPVLVFDAEGYYSELLGWLEKAAAFGFAKPMAEQFGIVKSLPALESFLRT